MKYYLCVHIPYENTDITCYDSLDDLIPDYISSSKSYYCYVIKGEEINITI